MIPSTIHTGRIPGRARLYLDVLYDPDRTGAFYLWPHATLGAFQCCARRLDHPVVGRRVAAAMLVRQNGEFGAPPAAIAAAQELAGERAVVIFTGQQAGLFGGPLYTIYKSITLLSWAARLREMLDRPVIPIFWIAADDHDFEEIRWAGLPDTQNQVRRLVLKPDHIAPRAPAAQVHLGSEIASVLAELHDAQLKTEFSDVIEAALRDDYAPGRTMVQAFGRWMTRILGPHGLVLFNPADAEAKALAAPLVAEEIDGHALTAAALSENGQRLEESGYHRQVSHPEGHTHLFHIRNGRHAIRADSNGLWTDPERKPHDVAVWQQRLHEDPSSFSPGVLLRPVVQSYLFPVVAAVCGPSEIAYWAQSRSLFDRFGVTMPVVLPRSSATVIEQKIRSAVNGLGHEIPEFFGDIEALINRHFERSFPSGLAGRFAAEKKQWEERLAQLKESVVAFEPTLDKTFEVDAGRIASSWDHLEKKVFQAHKRKGEEIRAKFYKLAAHLYPEGRPQERVFNITYYLNKYGFDFLSSVRRQLAIGTHDHQLIEP
ncbi:MAG: bacillithiol biosynthesis cysteine-adding enzyme BshC [Candidatus Zixiibacteriota bacterium]